MKNWPYKITLTIAMIFILSILFFCIFPNNWDSFPIIISIFMPLFILFFKLEYDEEQKRIQKRLVSRNFLLSYQSELNLIIRDFSKYRLIDSNKDLDLDKIFNPDKNYEEIILYKDFIQEVVGTTRKNSKKLLNRLEIHEKLSQVIIQMLRHNELVFTDEAYNLIEKLNYYYVWHFKEHYLDLQNRYSELYMIYAVLIDSPSNKQNVIDKWSDLCDYVRFIENRKDMDNSISSDLEKLINLLNDEKITLDK
ncbi:hypothetical protein U970_02510 [Staphylococcus aureus 56824-10]|uniref:hypothetical protein n=2 Tax=Staphylococcus aureus TaxID=1280 RepID=UPI000447F744|nr:hypothetical protein [Staphylococcus aureus]EZW50457.1 hypothetical protein U970_02510 [Staphylococcus aureus 56824-10]GBY65892.1 hypothetical protein M6K074_2285 [Staphylococcus aureus]GBY65998.1 hypothetical protein M6K074_2391 [Staphylococcus aureus]